MNGLHPPSAGIGNANDATRRRRLRGPAPIKCKALGLAFAQALLHAPDILFIDESTSALVNDTEAYLMRMVNERLPRCTLVSAAHRLTLSAFHDRQLHLQPPPSCAS